MIRLEGGNYLSASDRQALGDSTSGLKVIKKLMEQELARLVRDFDNSGEDNYQQHRGMRIELRKWISKLEEV